MTGSFPYGLCSPNGVLWVFAHSVLVFRSKLFDFLHIMNYLASAIWSDGVRRMFVAGWWVVRFSRFVPFVELVALELLSSESGNQAIYCVPRAQCSTVVIGGLFLGGGCLMFLGLFTWRA